MIWPLSPAIEVSHAVQNQMLNLLGGRLYQEHAHLRHAHSRA